MNRLAIVIGIIVIVTISSVVVASKITQNQPLASVLYILPEKDFDYTEFTTTRDILLKNNIKVTLASTIVGEISDHVFGKYKSDILIKDVNLDNFEMVCVIGGNGMKLIEYDSGVHQLLKDARDKNKFIASICYGPVVLSRAGILNGVESTVYQSDKNRKILEDNGVVVSSEKLVMSGKILTAAAPEDSTAFGEKMVEILKENMEK
jgi:putative intracellular protease/amidase